MASRMLVTVAVGFIVVQTWATDRFLATPKLNVEELEAQLLAELKGGANSPLVGATTQRLTKLEATLTPMFAAVPKERDGTLSHSVVRYVLQRFFAHQHGWSIRSFEPFEAANATNKSDPSVQDWAPAYIQDFLEKLSAGRGVNLRELAVLAATLEDLVKKEETTHLMQAYASNMVPTSGGLLAEQSFKVLETYMMIYMLRGNWTETMALKVDRLIQLFSKKVSHWDDTLIWLQKLVSERNDASKKPGSGLDFNDMAQVASEIGDRFATFNTAECGRLKSDLAAKESAMPGRVRLVDFYKLGLHGAWEFNEKLGFLRDIGTLDESDPSTPLVIIPNYVQARTNCLAVSNFYAVCCPNECEHLMRHLEAVIVGATARPSLIARTVSKLSSPTVNAPRNLSKPLMQRLQDIAAHHGGEVPIHGRLFAQWMHHAFPRECAYPHLSGSTSAQTAEEWLLKTGQEDSTLSEKEIMAEVAADSCRFLPKGVECDNKAIDRSAVAGEESQDLPWDSSEELLIVHEPSPVQRVAGRLSQMDPLRDIMTWCALASFIYGLCWTLKSTYAGRHFSHWIGMPISSSKAEKSYV